MDPDSRDTEPFRYLADREVGFHPVRVVRVGFHANILSREQGAVKI